MIVIMSTKQRKKRLNLMMFCFLCVFASQVYSGVNPVAGGFPVSYRKDLDNDSIQEEMYIAITILNCRYIPENTGWCLDNHQTLWGGNKFDHCHVSTSGFPFCYLDPEYGDVTVYADDVNAYWDIVYDGYQRVSNPTCVCNCHGHALESDIWINDMSTIIYDDFISPVYDLTLAYLKTDCNHSVKIQGVCNNTPPVEDVVYSTSEKMNTSGVYFKTHPCPCPDGFSGYDPDDPDIYQQK
jgi:hypothetical protein